ncbi:MAG: glutamate 5-kinase [Chloroflexi bacterium]|nr:glutamate 5-kinase [Chloroflexota bacterium]
MDGVVGNRRRPKRLVVKLGSGILTGGGSEIDAAHLATLMAQVAALHRQGHQVVVVTSGAAAAGRMRLGPLDRSGDIPRKQVLAAVGQARLMHVYEEILSAEGITIAQALLTQEDCSNRGRYLNARNTLLALLDLKVIPIVNENDVVANEEFRVGDNDRLSALVANLVEADLLLLLTDTEGLFTADPRRDPEAGLISVVTVIDRRIEALAGGAGSSVGTGGMKSKIVAARLATRSGVEVVIASGHSERIVERVAAGEPVGTRFLPVTSRRESRARYIMSGLVQHRAVLVDRGAAEALLSRGRSLLPAGVVEVRGRFHRGDPVAIQTLDGQSIGCGLANYSSPDVTRLAGCRSEQIQSILGYDFGSEVVHRNNLVVFREGDGQVATSSTGTEGANDDRR